MGWSLDHPRLAVASTLLLTLVLGWNLPDLELRTDGAALYPLGGAAVELTRWDRDTFSDPEQAVVLLTVRDGGPPIATAEGLRALVELHQSLAALPAADGPGVRSLASLLEPPPDFRTFFVRNFLDRIPDDPRRFSALLERIHAHPVTPGLFLSRDGAAAAFYVPLAAASERGALVDQLEAWVAARRALPFDLRLTGPLIAEALLGSKILEDLGRLIPIMVLVIALVLYRCLRTLGGVLVPMAEVALVLVWTLGAMALFGVPITLVTTILPIILTTMAVTDEIHLLERFQSRLGGAPATGRRRRQAVAAALADVGRPIVLTSLTTALGFLSFLSATMAPVRHFGLFSALGILLAMLLTFTFIPALLMLLPASWLERPAAGRRQRRSGASLMPYERLAARHRGRARLIGLLLTAACAPGILRLSVQDSWLDNFDPETDLVTAARDFDAGFWGAYRFDLVLRAESRDFFLRPEGIRLAEAVHEVTVSGPGVGGVASYLIPLQVLEQVAGKTGPVSSLPDKTLHRILGFADYLADRIDLRQYLLPDGRTARFRLFVRDADFRRAEALAQHLRQRLPPLLASGQVRFHASGDLPVALEVVRAIVTNQLRSIAWTAAGIAVLLSLALGSLRLAASLLAPLAASVATILGLMGYAGMPLGIATSMFAALTLGVGVDFAIHFAHACRRSSATSGRKTTLTAALSRTGKALRWNMAVLALGFLVLAFSDLRPNHGLGLLLAGSMVTCYLMTLLFLPSLLPGVASGGGTQASTSGGARRPGRAA